jgi:hypothetical protein
MTSLIISIYWILLTLANLFHLDLAHGSMKSFKNSCSQKYALLVGGGTEERDNFRSYYENIKFVNHRLIKFGYDTKNIKILFYGGNTLGHPIVDSDSTKKNFCNELRNFSKIIGPTDSLLIFRSGHGIIELNFSKYGILSKNESLPDDSHVKVLGPAAVMCFPDGPLSSFVFQKELKKIKAEQIIVILNQCYSGMFTDITNKLNHTVVISETDEVGIGFNSIRLNKKFKSGIWPFVKCIFDGFLINGSQKKSVIEAYHYMLECNPNLKGIGIKADRPLLKECPQIRYGSGLTMGNVYIY